MKRIAVISYHSCPLNDEKWKETGGQQIYTLELSKELSKKGRLVDIYTRVSDKKSPKIVTLSSTLRIIHLPAGEQKNIPRKNLEKHIPEFLKNFYNFLREENITYDLINCHYYLSGLIGLDIKKKLKTPFYITFHTLALMKNLIARSIEEKEDLDRIKAELLLTKTADKIIATSEQDAEYIYSLYNCPRNKIRIIIPGIDLNKFKPADKKIAKRIIKADENHRLILFVGRIVPLKGIDVLLYALKILVQQTPDLKICLWIVGASSNELKRLNEIKNLLNLTTFVKFVGMKSHKELPNYYNASELVVMPSIYESFGIIALESMACGVPVITTDATGVSELFDKKHDYLVTSASNPILLAGKIKKILTDKKEHQRLSKGVLNKVQDLTWQNSANSFIKILNKI